MDSIKTLNIFKVYVLFYVVTAINFVISISFASPGIKSLFIIFTTVSLAFFIIGGILAWFAQSGAKWARITFSIYCAYRVGDYFWGYVYREVLPQSFFDWAQAIFIICAWAFLLLLVIAKGSNKQRNTDSGADTPTPVRW